MTMKEIMRQYFMGEMNAITLIRLLSGMFDPKNAVNLLNLICTITRHEQGDIDSETFNEVWKFGIDLKFNKGDYPQEYDTMPLESLKKELEILQEEKDKNIEKEAEHLTLDHEISLLVSYLMYRERQKERDVNE